jgi:hypothetical protein
MLVPGFSGERDRVQSVFDGVAGDGFSRERMLDGLGGRWELERNYFKVHHCACAHLLQAGTGARGSDSILLIPTGPRP